MSNSDCPEQKQPNYNSISWNDLSTSDPEAAVRFYSELFGWKAEKFPMPGGDYTMLSHKDDTFGGVMATQQPGGPPHWLNYVSVEKLEPVIEKAKSLGAKLCAGPIELGEQAGRIAILQDPQGAAIGLHQHPTS